MQTVTSGSFTMMKCSVFVSSLQLRDAAKWSQLQSLPFKCWVSWKETPFENTLVQNRLSDTRLTPKNINFTPWKWNKCQINPKRQEEEGSRFSTTVLGFVLKQEAGGRSLVRLCPEVPFILSTACCARTAIPLTLVWIKVPAGTSVDGRGNTWSRVLHQASGKTRALQSRSD